MEGLPATRWQDEEQLHLTLRFVGEVERPAAEDLATALGRLRSPPFALHIAGVGRFEDRGRATLWAAIAPRLPLAALAAKVERACQSIGLPAERRAYLPHITLARLRRGADPAEPWLERWAALSSAPFTVDRFTLYESHLGREGGHHEAVAHYRLR